MRRGVDDSQMLTEWYTHDMYEQTKAFKWQPKFRIKGNIGILVCYIGGMNVSYSKV